MKRARWDCSEPPGVTRRVVALLVLALALVAPAVARIVHPLAVGMQASTVEDPAALAPRWLPVSAPDGWARSHAGLAGGAAWYRVEFDRSPSAPADGSWALYLPYLYDGARLWLNGEPLGSIAQTTEQVHVRWERPHLVWLPEGQLRVGRNEVLLRAVSTDPGAGAGLLRASIGPGAELLPMYDRRVFWVHTMPQNAVATCLVVGLFVGFVWWRSRGEVLYGLFGLVAVLWSIRTLTFVIEVMPAPWWPWWRALYHTTTGGFIVALALFAMRFAGFRQRWVARVLLGYWLVGPLAMLASGGRLDSQVGFVWTGGMIPIGLSVIGFTGVAAWRQRSGAAFALLAAVALGTSAGIHDYLIAWGGAFDLPSWLRDWMAHRIFLLHNASYLLLLVMVGILTLRFVHALETTADLNRHLEERVAERERELQARYAQVARLEREQAAAEERQRIMQDLHDGLGSQLFTALLRIERGGVDSAAVAQLLRDCIADMRLTFEVIPPEKTDLRSVLGNFRFRWERLLHEAGVRSAWDIDLPAGTAGLAPLAALQLLRIVQEALTNVLKHAAATQVDVALRMAPEALTVCVQDDGRGLPPAAGTGSGRGLANMRQRARRLGGTLDIDSRPGTTCVRLQLPRAGHD